MALALLQLLQAPYPQPVEDPLEQTFLKIRPVCGWPSRSRTLQRWSF